MSVFVGGRIPDHMLEPLNMVASYFKRSKSFMIGEALAAYIVDKREEMEDMIEIEKDAKRLLSIRNSNSKLYSAEEADVYLNEICPE